MIRKYFWQIVNNKKKLIFNTCDHGTCQYCCITFQYNQSEMTITIFSYSETFPTKSCKTEAQHTERGCIVMWGWALGTGAEDVLVEVQWNDTKLLRCSWTIWQPSLEISSLWLHCACAVFVWWWPTLNWLLEQSSRTSRSTSVLFIITTFHIP